MALDAKYGKIDIPGVPDDEPVFVIRGRDAIGPRSVESYAVRASGAGCDREFIDGVNAVAASMKKYQDDNPELVKRPD